MKNFIQLSDMQVKSTILLNFMTIEIIVEKNRIVVGSRMRRGKLAQYMIKVISYDRIIVDKVHAFYPNLLIRFKFMP